MIFSESEHKDFLEIMALIDSFAEANNAKISVNEDSLFHMIKRIHTEFPCIDGAENANVFKKSSAFLCEFVGLQVIEQFNCEMSDDLKKIKNNGSAIIGFYIVTTMLKGASVQCGKEVIKNSISLSKHSYTDIIDALTGITLQSNFRLVSVLLEQLTYKSNPSLQYDNTANL